ncbi:uncharacterized protein LOC120132938 [Hibiscus syriacus]|uniref:uncharacterized protein LOC120132938 n=1 Tax=Hibiscus syriacus TaxID=106335 RepID=UPI0019244659|nr:uncharacterized protein LOC120132938 [Hibiscus syriacus]
MAFKRESLNGVVLWLGNSLETFPILAPCSVLQRFCGGKLRMLSLAGHNLYVFSFSNLELRDWVLENGPWHIQNKPLVLRKWEPNLRKLDFDLKCMPVWVQLYNVPLELFSRRLEFAKVCVKVEAGAVIPEVIQVVLSDGSFAKIRVYAPWFPKFCLECNTFGHLASSCAEVLKGPSKTKETKESHFWRKKVNSSAPAYAGKESLQLGVIEEVSVLALQELTAATLQVEKEMTDNPGKDDQVKILHDLASQGSKLEVKESVVSQSPGNAVIANSVKEVSGSGDLIDIAGDKIIPIATNCGGDFPSLQDSLNQKKKSRKKKKDNIGSSSKFESLAGGGVLDGPRKTMTASLGVAMLLNEIKTKKKEHLDKAKGEIFCGGGSGDPPIPNK